MRTKEVFAVTTAILALGILQACGSGGGSTVGSSSAVIPTQSSTPTPPPAAGLAISNFTLSMGNTSTLAASGGTGSYSYSITSGSSYASVASNVITATGIGSGSVTVNDGSTTATAAFSVKGASAIMVSANVTCATLTDGNTQCMGNDVDSITSGTYHQAPALSTVFGNFSQLAVSTGSYSFACALTSGAVKCAGDNAVGELGNTSAGSSSSTAVSATGLTSSVTKIVAGNGFSCALKSTGEVYCWGDNTFGEIGQGSATSYYGTPTQVTLGATATDISAYYRTACALLSSGAIKCWGRGQDGQLGNGTWSASTSPVVAVSSGASGVSVGRAFACAIIGTTVKCWGANDSVQLGNNGASVNDASSASVVNNVSNVSKLTSGAATTCALLSSGAVKCWGDNQVGDVGDSTSNVTDQAVQIFSSAADVQLGSNHGCARFTDKSIKCWGDNSKLQLGKAATTSYTSTPGIPSSNWQ